jgi:hypothetical protein|tara:strand:- start:178 stop:420 length:243 start_codon:yes stop_codon:yes gene_type:complete
MKNGIASLSLIVIVPFCLIAGTALMFSMFLAWGLFELGSAIRNALPSGSNSARGKINSGFERGDVVDVVWEDIPVSHSRA